MPVCFFCAANGRQVAGALDFEAVRLERVQRSMERN